MSQITDDQVRVALEASLARMRAVGGNPDADVVLLEGMRAALTAFLSSVGGDPVVTYSGRRLTPKGTTEMWGYLADGVEDLPRGTKLYTASALAARMAGGGGAVAWLIQRNGNTVACMAREPGNVVADDEVVVPVYTHPATARAGVDELSQIGSDPRVNVDSYAECIRAARSQIGAFRPNDFDPEDQWQWDKLTSLLEIINQQGADRG